MEITGAIAPIPKKSGSSSARWLDPTAQYAAATISDAAGSIVARGQGSIINNNGTRLFQISGVNPGYGYSLALNIYQDSSMAKPLGFARVSPINVVLGQKSQVSAIVLPLVDSGNIVPEVAGSATTAYENYFLNLQYRPITVTAFSCSFSNTGGALKSLRLYDTALPGNYNLPYLQILDSNGHVVGQCYPNCLSNGVSFWVNPSVGPQSFYIISNASGIQPNLFSFNTLDLNYVSYNASIGSVGWSPVDNGAASPVNGAITYQVLVGNGTSQDINQASLVYSGTNTEYSYSLASGQIVWVKYCINGNVIGLIGCYKRLS